MNTEGKPLPDLPQRRTGRGFPYAHRPSLSATAATFELKLSHDSNIFCFPRLTPANCVPAAKNRPSSPLRLPLAPLSPLSSRLSTLLSPLGSRLSALGSPLSSLLSPHNDKGLCRVAQPFVVMWTVSYFDVQVRFQIDTRSLLPVAPVLPVLLMVITKSPV